MFITFHTATAHFHRGGGGFIDSPGGGGGGGDFLESFKSIMEESEK